MAVRSTKIVATLGPASADPAVLGRLVDEGVDVFRLNFSHGSHDDHREMVARVRAEAARAGRSVAIMQDLQGPKIRVRRFADPAGVDLVAGEAFELRADAPPSSGDASGVGLSYPDLWREVAPGQSLLLDDGRLRLTVTSAADGVIRTTVDEGGRLGDHKGINVPGADLSIPAITEKDEADLALGVELGVDWLAVSFVRSAADVRLAREKLRRHRSEIPIVAKIEKPGAVSRFDEILAEADGVMVARGDLGVEMSPEQVPVVQKSIIDRTRLAGKPVITATQMLESMMRQPRPTRAEASDVANAIFDGTAAVMLSGETAAGRYPVEAVQMMARVAAEVEGSPLFEERTQSMRPDARPVVPDAIALSACRIAEYLSADCIVVFTASGTSAWRIARFRPRVPVLALTPDPRVRARLALAFGVRARLSVDPEDTDHMITLALETAVSEGFTRVGQHVVIAAGAPFGLRGTTNMLRVETVRS